MLPVAVKTPVVGSYNSALANSAPVLSAPPLISTVPLLKSVAVWSARLVVMPPVAAKANVVGSYNSALAKVLIVAGVARRSGKTPGDEHRSVAEQCSRVLIARTGDQISGSDERICLGARGRRSDGEQQRKEKCLPQNRA